MAIIDKNDVNMGDGYYDENNIWRWDKRCFVHRSNKCECNPQNAIYAIDYSMYREPLPDGHLDPFTFGNSKAAVIIVEILNEINNEKITHKVSSFLTRYNTLIRHTQDIKDETSRRIIGYMLIEKINKSILEVPDRVMSYMKNVAISRVKDKLIRNL